MATNELLAVLSFMDRRALREASAANNDVPVRELRLPHGDRGARKLARLMAQQARRALTHPITIQTAHKIATPGPDPTDIALALRDWLEARWHFEPDPYGIELLQTPAYLLELIERDGFASGDCDDIATLAAALGIAKGLRARFVLISFGNHLPLSHVLTQLETYAGWVEMDITRPAQLPAGLTIRRVETREV